MATMKSAASTLRKQLKDIQERKKQWYLIYWPEEESYSEVPPSKLVEPKNPAVGDKVKVKDGKKVHTGEVVGFGSKMEIEELMLHLERDNEEETTAEREEAHGRMENEKDHVETEQKTKKAKKRPRDKKVSQKPPKKKAKIEAGTILRIVAHDPPAPSEPGPSSVTNPTTSTEAGRSAVTEPPTPSVPGPSSVTDPTTSTEAGRSAVTEPPTPSVPGPSSVTDPTTSTEAGRSAVTEPPTPSIPAPSRVIEQSTPAANAKKGNIETHTEIVDLSSAISTPSSVPSVPSPVKMGEVQNGELEDHHQSVDQLTSEIEVQELIDRVTILEEGQEHMLKVQRSILKNQEQILSRLAALEKRNQASAFGTPAWYTHGEPSYDTGDFSFESVDDSYMLPPPYIPPPPVQHIPHSRRPPALRVPLPSPAPRDPPPLAQRDPHPPLAQRDPHPPMAPRDPHPPAPLDPHPPMAPRDPHPPAPLDPHPPMAPRDPHPLPIHTPPSHPAPHVRVPFRQLYQSNASVGQGGRKSRSIDSAALPSSAINKKKLVPPETVIENNRNLMCPSKVSTLALKLAKESFFGEDMMARCTFAGSRDRPALPTAEKNELKALVQSFFPQYWRTPQEFEPIWSGCINSIGQGCKRLRSSAR